MDLPLNDHFVDNVLRIRFNHCLENIIPKYKNMSLLLPKQGWDSKANNLMKNDSFTTLGISMYWRAIDSVIHFWDTKKQSQVVQKTKADKEAEDTIFASWQNNIQIQDNFKSSNEKQFTRTTV